MTRSSTTPRVAHKALARSHPVADDTFVPAGPPGLTEEKEETAGSPKPCLSTLILVAEGLCQEETVAAAKCFFCTLLLFRDRKIPTCLGT